MSTTRFVAVAVVVLVLALAGCGSVETTSAPTKAAPTKAAPTAAEPVEEQTEAPAPSARKKIVLGEGGGKAGEALCTFFTAAEVGERLGMEAEEGKVAGPLDSGCQWMVAGDSGGNLMIQTTPDRFWEPPKNDPNAAYKAIEGVGDEAYTSKGRFGDWTAAAQHDGLTTIVSINTPDADAELALSVLKETLARM